MNKKAKIDLINDLLSGKIDKHGNSLVGGLVFIDNNQGEFIKHKYRQINKSGIELDLSTYESVIILPDNGRN